MNALVIKILAVGLTLSQLFTKPVEQFKTQFSEAEQAQVEQLLRDGCGFMTKEFGAEQIDFDFLFSMMISNIKSAQEKAPSEPAGEAPSVKLTSSLTDLLDIPTIYAAYKQYCKNEKTDDSPVKLSDVISYYNQAMADLPDHAKLKGLRLPESTLVLDGSGARFTEIYADNNRRKWISIKDIPDFVQKAFVAAEDKRFFQHKGIDVRGIIRAFATSISSKARPQGGSTITQQVAKNLLVGDDLTFERKMREMVVATRLEKTLSKQEILELYLNFVFLGRTSWGVQMAAESYFGKGVRKLTVSEAAILAAMPRGPNYYHPELHADRLAERREYVLSRMKEDGYLAEAQFQQAVKEKSALAAFESPRTRAAFYFLDEIQRDARTSANIPSLTASSYIVKSTIDREMQRTAEVALQDGLADYEAQAGRTGKVEIEGNLAADMVQSRSTWQDALAKVHGKYWDIQWPIAVVVEINRTKSGAKQVRVGLPDGRLAPLTGPNRVIQSLQRYDLVRVNVNDSQKTPLASLRVKPTVQGAIVVMENRTGRVLAMSGGFSYAISQLNRATRSARQPGSTLKPFIYLSALNLGYQPNTLIPDMAVTLPPIDRGGKWWSPKNYDGGSRGLVTIRKAVEQSLNLPTVRIMSQLGDTPEKGLDYIGGVTQAVGIYQQPIHHYPFVLGAQPARLIDMAVAYATVANIGLKPVPHFIDSIDQGGKRIYTPNAELQAVPTVDRVAFYQLRRILEGTVARGTAVKLKDLTNYVAGKTGTSNNENDAWFVGITNDLVIAVWVGYDSRNVASSLGARFTGARVALPIAERVLRYSFEIYKPKELLYGAPAEIKNKIATVPIDVNTGEINGGNFPEIFRLENGLPKDTIMSLLRGNERQMVYSSEARGDEDQMGYEDDPRYRQTPVNPYYDRDAYVPGYDDMYDMWRRRNRRVDPFFADPYRR